MRPDAVAAHFRFWEGDQQALFGGVSLWHLGGHFAGAQIAHWKHGANGKGALFVGDIIQVRGPYLYRRAWTCCQQGCTS